MPFINVKTNSSLVTGNKEALKAELGKAIECIPGKTEGWLMVNIDEPSAMYFKGSDNLCAMFEVSIFGSTSDSAYRDLTIELCGIAEEFLGVPAERTYVKYAETDKWGWNNMNF
ncbi:MAG: hypothetical protein K6C14_08100 [Eubacterium sp.]|nr:hypothetical protein [Eubacterium sp.]